MRAPKSEYDAVEAVVQKFVDAIHAGDSSIVRPFFVKTAGLYGNVNGGLEEEPIETLMKNIDACGAAGSAVNFRTDILALEESIAVVCLLEENMGPMNFTNYFTLMKINGEWKFLIHAYNQNSDTIA